MLLNGLHFESGVHLQNPLGCFYPLEIFLNCFYKTHFNPTPNLPLADRISISGDDRIHMNAVSFIFPEQQRRIRISALEFFRLGNISDCPMTEIPYQGYRLWMNAVR